jgi:hypothetical protein
VEEGIMSDDITYSCQRHEWLGNIPCPCEREENTQSATDCINDALAQAQIIDARLRALAQSIPDATRNADRCVLANDAVSMHLDLSVVRELLRDARGSLREEETR